MAIDPTAWNGLVDDDGSNLTGSLWNKAAIKSVVLDPPLQTLRGTNYALLDLAGSVTYDNLVVPTGPTSILWLFNPTGAINITGITAEPTLTQHLFVNVTAYSILFYNAHVGSIAANRLICPGYTTYTLPTWGSIWTTYLTGFGWILHKA